MRLGKDLVRKAATVPGWAGHSRSEATAGTASASPGHDSGHFRDDRTAFEIGTGSEEPVRACTEPEHVTEVGTAADQAGLRAGPAGVGVRIGKALAQVTGSQPRLRNVVHGGPG